MEIKQLQHEILEAERLIERNKMIIQMHMKLEEQSKHMGELQQKEAEADGD